jgi:hypothetical protein
MCEKSKIRRLAAKFRCQSAADSVYGTEIPLPVRWPNRVQVIDIHIYFGVQRAPFGG